MSADSERTKGPWAVLPYYRDGAYTGSWFAYDGAGVRFLFVDGDGNRDSVSDDDAYTIAFAPTAFEALRHIASHCEGEAVSIAQDVIDRFERALAKHREDRD